MDEKRKPTQAVALEYDPADNAPKVIAMGRGALADRIKGQRFQYSCSS